MCGATARRFQDLRENMEIGEKNTESRDSQTTRQPDNPACNRQMFNMGSLPLVERPPVLMFIEEARPWSLSLSLSLSLFLDAFTHLYKRVCLSVVRSVTTILLSVNLTINQKITHPQASWGLSILSTSATHHHYHLLLLFLPHHQSPTWTHRCSYWNLFCVALMEFVPAFSKADSLKSVTRRQTAVLSHQPGFEIDFLRLFLVCFALFPTARF